MSEVRPGVWKLRAYVGSDSRGHPMQTSRTVHGGKRAAENQLRALVDDVERSRSIDRSATLGRLLERWLDHITPHRKTSTMREYRRSVTANILPALGGLRLDRLTAEQLDRAYTAWADRGLSPASIRQQHAIISAAIHQAERWGWVERSVARRATPPTVRRKPAMSITGDELRQLVAAAEARHDSLLATAIALAALTGCRRGELCALRWPDVDLNTGVLTVARSLTVGTGGRWELTDTKTHQARRLALDPVAVAVFERRRLEQQAIARAVQVDLHPDAFVLCRARGDGLEPCLPDGLTHAFTAACIDTGLCTEHQVDGRTMKRAVWRFHDLRHFAATTTIAAGVDVRTVAGRLGHADASTTLRVYAHAVEVADQAAANILGLALEPGPVDNSPDAR